MFHVGPSPRAGAGPPVVVHSNAPNSPHEIPPVGVGLDPSIPNRAVSANNPLYGFPYWYQDDAGTRLTPCLDTNGLCPSRLDHHQTLLPVGRITKAGQDVFPRQAGEVFKHFLLRHAGGEVFQHGVNRDPHSADAGLAAALPRLDGDDLAVVYERMMAKRDRR